MKPDNKGLVFEGDALRCVAMPLGGVGTGNVAICGDGSLRQWQIHNRPNHVGYVPFTFFAIAWRGEMGFGGKLLQSRRFWDEPGFVPPPTTSDHYVPPELRAWARDLPGADVSRFTGRYPVAELTYDLGEACPLQVSLTAWSPLAAKDEDASAWPAAIFDFTIRNKSDKRCAATLLSTLQNAVGWDARSAIDGLGNPGYGGNLNIRERFGDADGASLTSVALPQDHPTQGTMALAGLGGKIDVLPQWTSLATLWREFEGAGRLPTQGVTGTSPAGQTVNAAMTQRVELDPGGEARMTVVIAWHFPNRYVDWFQWEKLVPRDKSRFYLGNYYIRRGSHREWLPILIGQLQQLREKTEAYASAIHSALPDSVVGAVAANVANLRTNVCLWTEDGRFHGFEGASGASTWEGMHGTGGCCPMNCTHVWNYEQALSELWPGLFRSMRDTDWKLNQNPKGYVPHRTTLPVYLPRAWDISIGGPDNPAIDGLFAAILKTYQHWMATGDRDWLESVWPNVRRGLQWIFETHDTEGDGVIRGEQPNTYDIHLYGPNTFIGSQYLAALLAAEKLADAMGDEVGTECRRRFESGTKGYDDICFNGEYFVQRVPEGCEEPYQFGLGCCADQLLGQWWAHHLGLGRVLPEEHIKSALRAVFRRNFRQDFKGFVQSPRVFASDHDKGLLNATYEEGQRPGVPLLYSDEVWPGVEYAFAALCMHEGLWDEGLAVVSAVRARYDGTERNPFNEIECGDHYIRSLSGWSLLPAIHGCRYEAPSKKLIIAPRWPSGDFTAFASLGPATARIAREGSSLRLEMLSGEIEVEDLVTPSGKVSLNGRAWSPSQTGKVATGDILRMA